MRFQLFGSGRRATAAATSAGPRMSHRQALKALLTGAGVLGLAKVAGFGSTEAAYVTGPPDVVNTSLEVQGDLKVTSSGKVGVSTVAPATAVHVAGSTPALTVGPYTVSNRPGDIQAMEPGPRSGSPNARSGAGRSRRLRETPLAGIARTARQGSGRSTRATC